MARKGQHFECPPKKAATPADFLALREYIKLVLSGFRPVGDWRRKSKGRAQAKVKKDG